MYKATTILGIATLIANGCTGIITNDDDHGPISATQSAGTVSDSLTVSRFGNANYDIPIEVPKGLGDVTPSLSLHYSSASHNGMLGMGFSLSGIPRISRCFETMAADGHRFAIQYNDKDRFCLDGQKLTVTGEQKRSYQRHAYRDEGAIFATEIESFRHIKAVGRKGKGPAHFDAWYPKLLNYRFGDTSDSALMQAGREEVLSWSVSRVEDLSGNTMDFHYQQELGMSYPKSISYGGNTKAGTDHFAEVQFEYEIRPDATVTYIGNEKVHRQQRLTSVTTLVNGEIVRRYTLAYEQSGQSGRSRITSVSLCSQDVCLPETRFTWQNGQSDYSTIDTGIDSSDARSTRFADINGDGRPDILFPRNDTWQVRFAKTSGIGFHSPVDTGAAARNLGSRQEPYYPVHTFNADGDGRADLLFPNRSTDSWNIVRYRNGGFEIRNTEIGDARYEPGAVAAMGDMNGDGRDEVLGLDNYYPDLRLSSDNMSYLYGWPMDEYRSTLVTMSPADFNGDGLMDLAIGSKSAGSSSKRSLHLTNPPDPDVFILGQTEPPLPLVKFFEINRNLSYLKPDALRHPARLEGQSLDLNGDGFSDYLIAVKAEGRGDKDYVWELRMGTTSPREADGWLGENGTKTWNPVVVDLDSDGQSELLFPSEASSWKVLKAGSMASDETMMEYSSFSQTFPMDDGFLQAIDMDGDGLQDFLTHTDGTWKIHRRNGKVPNLLVGIVNGLGAKTTLRYAPLSDPSVHTPVNEDTLSYPTRSFNNSGQVVKHIQRSSGNTPDAGLWGTDYHYEGAQADVLGRGFLGFEKQSITDYKRNLKTVRTMSTTWPFQGMTVRETITNLSTNKALETTEFTLQKRGCEIEDCDGVSQNGFPGAVRPVTIGETKRKLRTDGTTVLSETTTTRTYDYLERLTKEAVVETQNGQEILTVTKHDYLRFSKDERFSDRKFAGLAAVVWTGSSTTESANNLTAIRDERVEYDERGLEIVKQSGSEGRGVYHNRWEYQRDLFGNITSSLLVSNRFATPVENIYSDDGRFLLTSTNELGHRTEREYNSRTGHLTREISSDGSEVSFAHDGLGNKIKEVDSYGNTSTWTRSAKNLGMTIARKNSSMPDTIETLDQIGRTRVTETIRDKSPGVTAKSIVLVDYDAMGNLQRRSVPTWEGESPIYEEFQYDGLGRQALHKKANGTTSKTQYDDDSISVTTSDNMGNSRTHRSERDPRGRVILRESSAGILRYTFGPFGTLLEVVDPLGNAITMSYDALGRRTKITDPDMGEWTFRYNREGRETRRGRPDDSYISTRYDLLGRIVSKDYWNQDSHGTHGQSYEYDVEAPGKLYSTTLVSYEGRQGESSETYLYNDQGTLVSTTRTWANQEFPSFTEKREFDEFGRVHSVSVPSGKTIDYNYSESGQLLTVHHGNAQVWEALKFAPDGSLVKERFGNGVESTREIDMATGHTLGITTGGGSIQKLAYEYDGFGNLLARHDLRSGQVEEFEYDELDRLVRVILDGVESESLRYNNLGNITHRSSVGDFLYEGVQPHALTRAGDATFAYDREGRMTSGEGSTIVYNSISKPSEISDGEKTNEFLYAPDEPQSLAESYFETESNYIYTQYYGKLWERSQYAFGDAEFRTRVRMSAGPSVKALWIGSEKDGELQEELLYHHSDHLGSVDVISDASGDVVERQSFSPFGARREQDWANLSSPEVGEEAIDTRGFTGHSQIDHLGLVHMGARMYSPKLGRFLSPDTIIQAPENSQSLNRYSYVFNNPLSYNDPTGHVAEGLGNYGYDDFSDSGSFDYSFGGTSSFMSGDWGSSWTGSIVSDSPKSEDFQAKEEERSDDEGKFGSVKLAPTAAVNLGILTYSGGKEWSVTGTNGIYGLTASHNGAAVSVGRDFKWVKGKAQLKIEDWRVIGSVSISASKKFSRSGFGEKLTGAVGGKLSYNKEVVNVGLDTLWSGTSAWLSDQVQIRPVDTRRYSRSCGGFGGGAYCN